MSGPKHTPTVLSGPCPSCGGLGYYLSVPGDYDTESFDCPDCAGTGKAWNSITANEKLRDAAPHLAEELSDLAKHLEEHDPQGDVQAWLRSLLDYHLPQARAALREAGVTDDA